jgi:hypothetical protein
VRIHGLIAMAIEKQRVAVLRRTCRQLAGDRAARAALVLDHELLAQPLAQLRRQLTGHDVVADFTGLPDRAPSPAARYAVSMGSVVAAIGLFMGI